jgi:hypothetical protein
MKVKEPHETWQVEVNGLKCETVPMIFDGKNWIVLSDEQIRYLDEGNRKQRKNKAKIFNKKYGVSV